MNFGLMLRMDGTRLIIVRHGETEWNASGRYQGVENSCLTEKGRAQAALIRELLHATSLDAIYSSDLGRAEETARIIANGRSVALEPGLRERHLGMFQGYTVGQLAEKYPTEWSAYSKHTPDYAVPGGQSIIEHLEIALTTMNRIAQAHAGGTVLIVTHGGVLSSLLRKVVGIPWEAPRRYEVVNCALNIFTVTDGTWRLVSWGQGSGL